MKINEKGFWENPTVVGHAHDVRLCTAIGKLIQKHQCKTVVDFGCGMGSYAKYLKSLGLQVEAYDGNPHTPKLTGGIGQVLDLSQEFDLGKKFDAVISLEVGEHIPAKFEHLYLNNISRHSSGLIILSWAIPGQDGDGHVNCQPNEYIMQQMLCRGHQINIEATKKLRDASRLWWFRNTLMVFE